MPVKTELYSLSLLCLFLLHAEIFGQFKETLDIDIPPAEFRSGHLDLGGRNSNGRTIDVNNYFVSIDGKPVIPVTGEFHFSRFPEEFWEEAIRKMRAGGISIIATYVFWNIHEEAEGVFDWKGSKDLRKFVELCAVYDYDVIVRIGPFCHGEIRNGGFPDWLLGKPLVIRSNDPRYLAYVERLYDQIGQQLGGLYFKDGGPVIGIQLENEYQHSASPWGLTYPGQPHDFTVAERDKDVTQAGVGVAGEDNPYANLGSEHMKVLKSLALNAGIEVPLYTATGWGNAAIVENGTLPVTAAYPYPTWAPEGPSDLYLYTNLQKDPDYAPVSYRAEDYPCFAAELGGGIMNTYDRRPVVPAESLDPMINRFLGSGANGIGYYMYHGGSTPRGERNYFSDVAIGCPIISYDFQAPIGEFGFVRPSFHRLKLIHFFLNSFGELLAPMQVILPESQEKLSPANDSVLKYSVRTDGESGFIFMNNFQDHLPSRAKENIHFRFKTGNGEIVIPQSGAFSLPAGEHAILPFNLDLGVTLLNYSTTQVLVKFEGPKGEYYVFLAIPGVEPEYNFARNANLRVRGGDGTEISESSDRFLIKCSPDVPAEFALTSGDGKRVNILTIPRHMAMNSYLVKLAGKEHLVFSEALVLGEENKLELLSYDQESFTLSLYPATAQTPGTDAGNISGSKKRDPVFSVFEINVPGYRAGVEMTHIQSNKFSITLPAGIPEHVNDLVLTLDYLGDTGMGFLNGDLVADHFYNGEQWSVGLKKFTKFREGKEMVFYFRPLYEEAPFLNDLITAGKYKPGDPISGFILNRVEMVPEYRVTLSF